MYEIAPDKMSDEFLLCWKAAGTHLGQQVDSGLQTWLRAHPYPPFLEHLSFRLGNQLFFVRVEDVDGKFIGPGNARGHVTAASLAMGRACVMPMKKKFWGGGWVADMPGWGLLDAESRKPVDPVALITDQKIEMTPWECHDFSVQVVRDYLSKAGFELMSWQGNPDVDPSIWFIGETRKPEWVVVRSAKFPVNTAARPANWSAIAESCSKLSKNGHFASVAAVSAEQPFASPDEPPVPLWRGYAMNVRFTGLEQ
jgi:hypothetical protein